MKKKTSELKNKSIGELEKEAHDLRVEIAKSRLEVKVNPAKDTNILVKKRKRLAVILTILGEKKELEELKR
ncbi:50S ribosomal protein L29 [Candidatus Roizmanbacteria bacterium]|nr:50S ribosomal protein L29 [Candidatus Roizmanbacteria bacterium]